MRNPWLAVDKGGIEYVFAMKPIRYTEFGYNYWVPYSNDTIPIRLPKGTIEKLLGYKLAWKDKPIQLKLKK